MLYTESMEMASPLLAPENKAKSEKTKLTASMKNRMAKPRIDLGVSLGSESFLVVTPKTVACQPNRVALRQETRKLVALGQNAALIEGREPEGVLVTRPIQNGIVVDAEMAAKLMSVVVSSSKHGLFSPPRIALAVPTGLSAVESQTLLATARKAGARSVQLVDQGLAAAIGAGRDLTEAQGHFVIQLGTGVAQATVSSLASPVVSKASRKAGRAMTEAIQEHIRREHQLLVDYRVADSVKKQIGSALEPADDKEMTIVGREIGVGKPVEKTVRASEIYQILQPFLAEVAQLARWVVAEMSTELLSDVHRNGVILAGEEAELNQLDRFLAQELRLPVRVPQNSNDLVAQGLQILLNNLNLRQAVFLQQKPTDRFVLREQRRGTGLLGLLVLTAGLALAASAGPILQQGAASSVDQYLGATVTPEAPIAEGWGWHQPDQAATVDIEDRRREQLEEENDRLRKLLAAPKAKKGLKIKSVVADVVSRDPRGWMSTLTLNVGSKQGIKKGMTVSDGINLVGQVSKIQNNRCQVKLFTDAKAVVAGKIKGRKASGVVVGRGEHHVVMRYLDPDSGIKKGDWVLTSGKDGVFPAGIRLGKVDELRKPGQENYLAAVIKPTLDLSNLENVVILK